jgi:hypothetical protein
MIYKCSCEIAELALNNNHSLDEICHQHTAHQSTTEEVEIALGEITQGTEINL